MLLFIRLLIKLGGILYQPAQCCFSATVMCCCQSPVSMLAREALHRHVCIVLAGLIPWNQPSSDWSSAPDGTRSTEASQIS